MICTLFPGRLGGALVIAACAVAAFAPGAYAQSQEVSVNPSSGAPGSQFTITMKNFGACPVNTPNCITIQFVQGTTKTTIATADSHGSSSFSGGPLTVPPSAAAGSATVHAFGPTGDASTGFTVTGAPPATTTTTAPGTTTSSAPTSTSSSTTTLTTIIPPLTEPSTTTTIATKNTSSHSDVPRYIAVALVVLAAAATAAVDTRMRRLKPPAGP